MTRETAGDVARNLVSHPYRRILLAVLDCDEAPVTTRALARAVCHYDTSMTVETTFAADATADMVAADDVCTDGVEQLAAQLHHNHLPRLASAGLLTYDRDEAVVTEYAYPAVGDRWVTSPPIDDLARTIAATRRPPSTPPD